MKTGEAEASLGERADCQTGGMMAEEGPRYMSSARDFLRTSWGGPAGAVKPPK